MSVLKALPKASRNDFFGGGRGFCLFLELCPQHMEVPRRGGQIRATAAELHHSSRQCWILNPLIEARDQTYILMDARQICFH